MPLMLMLDLNDIIDQLAMASSVHWCGHVLRQEDGHVLSSQLMFGIKGGRPERTWEKGG